MTDRQRLKLSGVFGLQGSATLSSFTPLPTAGHFLYCNTWPRVSGNFVARKLPAARAPAANKIGKALVMPTNDWKMLIPNTAASLQRAFRKPNAVVLRKRGTNTVSDGCYNTFQQQQFIYNQLNTSQLSPGAARKTKSICTSNVWETEKLNL